MLYTPEYQQLQQKLHDKGNYGVVGRKYGPMVSEIIDRLEIDHVLDYGCGRNQSLRKTLKPKRKITYQAYDPGWPEYADPPIPAQMVVCCDVLEHIEPDLLMNVMDHLEDLTEVILFATVHTGPAGKVLADGRNAHLIQQPMEWWLPHFTDRFHIQTVQQTAKNGFYVICHNQSLEMVDE